MLERLGHKHLERKVRNQEMYGVSLQLRMYLFQSAPCLETVVFTMRIARVVLMTVQMWECMWSALAAQVKL